MRPKYLLLLFSLLTILVTGYILSNSMKNAEESHAQSNAVMEVVEPVLAPVIRQETEEATEEATVRKLSFLVRKSAHFIEYTALGICVGGFSAALFAVKKRRIPALPVGMCVLVACCDEYIQSFVGRTSSIKDVALDLTGSLFGLLLAAAAIWLLQYKRGGTTQ